MSKLWYLQKQFILTLKEDSQPDAWQPMLPDRRHPIKTLITVTLKFSIGAPSTRKNVKLFFLFSLIAPNHGPPLIFFCLSLLILKVPPNCYSTLSFFALLQWQRSRRCMITVTLVTFKRFICSDDTGTHGFPLIACLPLLKAPPSHSSWALWQPANFIQQLILLHISNFPPFHLS